MTIFWILGTNGSGKTTIVNRILGESAGNSWQEFNLTLSGNPEVVVALGPYGLKIGGCDRLRDWNAMEHGILAAGLKYSNLIFEGALVSTVFERFRRVLTLLRGKGKPVLAVLLSTPLKDCLEGIRSRTEGSNPDVKAMQDKMKASFMVVEKLKKAGFNTITADRKTALDKILEEME